MLTAEEYVFKKMMTPPMFVLFMRCRRVISSCVTFEQLACAIKYNRLAREQSDFEWSLAGFVREKINELTIKGENNARHNDVPKQAMPTAE